MTIEAVQVGPPVDLRPLFATQREQLCELLDGLCAEDWRRPTVCTGWTVADVVRHMLGDLVGRISGMRDANTDKRPRPGESIGTFIDRTNGEWVLAARQLSPQLVIDMLRWAGPIHDETWRSRSLHESSLGVSWAGLDPAPVWLDAARDITEYWIHEQQVREAIGAPPPTVPDVGTVLDVLARGLPLTLGSVDVEATTVSIATLQGDPGWTLRRDGARWFLLPGARADAESSVRLDRDELWRRWTRQPGAGDGPVDPLTQAVWDHVAIVHSAPDAEQTTRRSTRVPTP